MKRWQVIAAALLSLLIVLLPVTPALAQDFEEVPPLLATVISKAGVLVDELLSLWVTGTDLTPEGEQLVSSLAQAAIDTANTLAPQDYQQWSPLMSNVISKPAVLMDGVLSYWVTGNTLTDPAGEQLVRALAQTFVNTVNFFAQLITLF